MRTYVRIGSEGEENEGTRSEKWQRGETQTLIPDAVDETLRNVTAGNEIGRYTSALKEEEAEEEKRRRKKA